METFLYRPMQAFLRYLDLPGGEPAHIYLAGLGLASTAGYPRVISGSPLASYRAILPDWFGCGYSDHPEAFGYTINDHAELLAKLLDQLQLRACTLVAHSMGGAVAIALADQRPDLVGRLVLAEANLDPGGGYFSRSVAAYSEQEFVQNGYRLMCESIRAQALQGDPGYAVAAGMWQVVDARGLHRSAASLVLGCWPSWRDLLYQLEIPRAYLFGEKSLPDPDFEVLPAHGIEVAVVPDAGHGMMWENPDGCAQAIWGCFRPG
jgi:pimeloyl-ACP methyl ester carboxylesterase